MSGGHFDYRESAMIEIFEGIKDLIENNGKQLSDEKIKEIKSWNGDDYFQRFPDEMYHRKYPDNVIKKFKEAYDLIRIGYTYAHRIDYLVSGDDGEESFIERLKEDLNEIKNNLKINPTSMYCVRFEDQPLFLSATMDGLKKLVMEHCGAKEEDVVFNRYDSKYYDTYCGDFIAKVDEKEPIKFHVYDLPVDHTV